MKKPENKNEELFYEILQKKKKISKMKEFFWNLGQFFFDKDSIMTIAKKFDEKTTKQIVVEQMLQFYFKNNITMISTDVEHDLLGLYTNTENEKKSLITKYNCMVQLNANWAEHQVKENQAQDQKKEIQQELSKIMNYYAKNILNKMNQKEDKLINLTDLLGNEDVIILHDLDQLISNLSENPNELMISKSPRSQLLEKDVSSLVENICDSEISSKVNKSDELTEKLFDLLSTTRDLNIFKKRLENEKWVHENPVISNMVERILEDNSLSYESGMLLNNQINVGMIESLQEIIQNEVERILRNVESLYKFKKGLMTKSEEEELLSKVDKVVQTELLEMYQKPRNPFNPGKEVLKKENKKESKNAEEIEVDQILDYKKGIQREKHNVADLLIRKDMFLRPKVIVNDKQKYLTQLENWKNEMKRNGLAKAIPDFDFEPMIIEKKRSEKGVTHSVFNNLNFVNNDTWQISETTGIGPNSEHIQLKMERLMKRQEIESELFQSLEELIMGNELNMFTCLYYLYANQRDIEDNQQDQNLENSRDMIVHALVSKSLKVLELENFEMDENTVNKTREKVGEMIKVYTSILEQYLENNKIWKNQKLSKSEKIEEIIESFEDMMETKIGSFYKGIAENLKKYLKTKVFRKDLNKVKLLSGADNDDDLKSVFNENELEKIANLKKLEEKKNQKDLQHFKNLQSLMDSGEIIYKNELERIDYHIDNALLDDNEKLRDHFSLLFGNANKKGSMRTLQEFVKDKSLFKFQPSQGLELLNKNSVVDRIDFRIEVILSKLKQLENEEIQLNQYQDRSRAQRSQKYKYIPEPLHKKSIIRKIKEMEGDVIEYDDYQEELGNKGFLDSDKDPEMEDLSGADKSYIKNSQAVSTKLSARIKFNSKEENLVLEEINKAKQHEDNLLSEAIKYITETSKIRGDGKNTFWQNNLNKFDMAEPYEEEVTMFQNVDILKEDKRPDGPKKVMSLQEIYSGIMLKKKLKNYIKESLRENIEERKLVTNKSEVQGDFMKFILDNFHGSGIQKYMLGKWMREMPNLEVFYQKWEEEYVEFSENVLTKNLYSKGKVMTAKELKNYDYYEQEEKMVQPSNASKRDIIEYASREYDEIINLQKEQDILKKKFELFDKELEEKEKEIDGEALKELIKKNMDSKDLEKTLNTLLDLQEVKDSFTEDITMSEDITESAEFRKYAIKEGNMNKFIWTPEEVSNFDDLNLRHFDPWNEADKFRSLTKEEYDKLKELEEDYEAAVNDREELEEDELKLNENWFTKDNYPIMKEKEELLKKAFEDGVEIPDDRTKEEIIDEELKVIETFKQDLVFYISSRVADHRFFLEDRIKKHEKPMKMTQGQKIENIVDRQKNNIITTFYDNKALEEFNTLRHLRELSVKAKKYKYDDVDRSLHQKGRDTVLEKLGPEMIRDDVYIDSYKPKHPDDEKTTYKNEVDLPKKDVFRYENKEMRELLDNGVKEEDHEVNEIMYDTDGDEKDSDDEFYDKYLYQYEPHKPKQVTMRDHEHLRSLIHNDLEKEQSSSTYLDPNTMINARDWFTEKYQMLVKSSDLTEKEKVELDIIAHLFYLNKHKKITLGDIYLELSRRRLDLNPHKYKGVGIHHIQEYRTKLKDSFAKKDYMHDLTHSENEYLALFPPDKITDYDLLQDKTYYKLIQNLMQFRNNENPVYGDATIEDKLKEDPVPLEKTVLKIFVHDGEGNVYEMKNEEIPEELKHKDPKDLKIEYVQVSDQKENLPEVCLEMELFNLIDLYFAMYGRDKKLPETKKLIKEDDANYIIKKSIPTLKLDEEIQVAFNSSLKMISEPSTNEVLLPFRNVQDVVENKDFVEELGLGIIQEKDLDILSEKLMEEIITVCPHVYPDNFGEDPGLENKDFSIQNQILRRFDDHISVKSPVQMWRKTVDLEFTKDDEEIPEEDVILDPIKRPDYLKKADYDDAKEIIEKRRMKNIINEMSQDPFFESKLEEYFSSCHQMSVQNQYQKQWGHLEKPEEILDRKNSPLVKNELLDFLMRYSDIRMQTRDQFYSSYAGKDLKSKQFLQKKKSDFYNNIEIEDYMENEEPSDKENVIKTMIKLKDFETKFYESSKNKLKKPEVNYNRYVTPSPGYDIVDLENRLNRLRDKQEYTGMHGIYRDNNAYTTNIPHALPLLDIRRPAEEWVLEKIDRFLDEIMNTRLSLERYLTRDELQSFDLELKRLLTRENIRDAVLKQLDQELTTAEILKKNYVKNQDEMTQTMEEIGNWDNLQSSIQKKIKNPDALKRLYAYDSVRSMQTKIQEKKEADWKHEEHLYTMEMLMEEAMGADYDYLLWQHQKDDYKKTGSNEYMNKEGYRSKRYINNEFYAKYYGKTFFEETQKFDVYPQMGTTKFGTKGILAEPHVSDEFKMYQKYHSSDPMQNSKIFENVMGGLGNLNQENQMSKSLGWYFKKINEEFKISQE